MCLSIKVEEKKVVKVAKPPGNEYYKCDVIDCKEMSTKKTDMCKLFSLKMCTSDITESPTKGVNLEEVKNLVHMFIKPSFSY